MNQIIIVIIQVNLKTRTTTSEARRIADGIQISNQTTIKFNTSHFDTLQQGLGRNNPPHERQ